ncbi:MAG: metallophosphoesterase family protein [Candidatus Saliniplasma sp.]
MSLKVLIISDIHGSYRSLNRINASIYKHELDSVVVCGDITHFGDKEEAVDILEKIDAELIMGVTGNCDPIDVEESFDIIGGVNLNLNIHSYKGYSFAGLAGHNHTKQDLSRFRDLAKSADIFVLHSPPYGYLDEASRGKHIGERELLEIISKYSPRLILSGHVHESRGIIQEEGTVYVNPGPAYEDNLAIVEIGEEIKAKLI